MTTIHVPAAAVPVLADVDLLVCGGGPAGVGAAVTAARLGLQVLLIERWTFCGGMGTAALVNIWHTSDKTKPVILGLVDEVIARCMKRGLAHFRGSYERNETHDLAPEGMKLVFDELLKEAGVQVLYATVAGEVLVEGDRISAVLVDTKRGRRAIRAAMVVDATGDGDVAFKAGVPCHYGRAEDGLVQGMTLMYRLGGIDPEVKQMPKDEHDGYLAAMKLAVERGELPSFGPISFNYYARGGHPNMCPVAGNPLDEADLSRATMEARHKMHQFVNWFRAHVRGFSGVWLEQSGSSLGIRESRRIEAMTTLTSDMVLKAKKHSDAIGHGFWMIDIHDPKGSGKTTWEDGEEMLGPGKSYHIPFSMCVPRQLTNLLVAGRCASSTHRAHASVRLQTHAMAMGQGCGAAAVVSRATGVGFQQVNVSSIQTHLRNQGAYLADIPAAGSAAS
jgi:hypothetical protein